MAILAMGFGKILSLGVGLEHLPPPFRTIFLENWKNGIYYIYVQYTNTDNQGQYKNVFASVATDPVFSLVLLTDLAHINILMVKQRKNCWLDKYSL